MYKRLLALLLVLLIAVPQGLYASPAKGDMNAAHIADPYAAWPHDFTDFAPPVQEQIELVQPDGTSFFVSLNPMENGGLAQTLDEYTIVANEEGWWVYADIVNGKVVPSTKIVGKDKPTGIGKKVGLHKSLWLDDNNNDIREPLFDAVRDIYSPNNSVLSAQVQETVVRRYVVLLVEFQDVKFEPYQTREWFEQQLKGFGGNPTGTLSEYYYEMSYGKFLPMMDVYGPFTSDYDMATYDYQITGGRNVGRMINEDIGPKAKDLVDWDSYDNTRVVTSGYRSVDMVVVIHAGPGKEATGIPGQIWSHATSANFRTGQYGEDGLEVRIRAVNTCPAMGFNIGVVAHEMGHSIGESDYYNTSSPQTTSGTGEWDLMASGSWVGNAPAGSNPTQMNPFSRIRQGWIEPTVITETTLGIEIGPRSANPHLYKIPLGGSGTGTSNAEECLYIEFISTREPTAKFDKAAPGSGLLIWHYDAGGSNSRADARMRMRVEEYDYLDGTQELGSLYWNRGEPSDPWFDTRIGMTPYTVPSTNRNTSLSGSTKTGWYVTNISAIGPTMTFDVIREQDMGKVAAEQPKFLNEPVIAGHSPAVLTTNVHNDTGSMLETATVEFWARSGTNEFLVGEAYLQNLAPGRTKDVSVVWVEPFAGKFEVWAKVVSNEIDSVYDAGTVRVFERQANVLIVDDDDGYKAEEAYEGVLTALGVPYVMVTGTTTLDVLNQYELVIWHAGQAGRAEGQLSAHDRNILKAYLNGGGRLWMNSPRLAAALNAAAIDPAMLRDYFGARYPMSNQNSGGYIIGTGHPVGGNKSYALRAYPGRSIQDYLQPAESQLGTATPLFAWTEGDYLGMEVIGNEQNGNFHVIYFGFCMSQLIHGNDRLQLTQQVLDRFGISSVHLDNSTYLLQSAVGAKVYVHDPGAVNPLATIFSDAMPEGLELELKGKAGDFTVNFNMQKTGSQGNSLQVNEQDTLRVRYLDSAGVERWAIAAVKTKVDLDRPATIHHDNIFITTDAEDLEVMAVVTDDINVKQVYLYYRVAGANSFANVKMKESVPGVYTAIVPAKAITPVGLEYYIVASDSQGNLTYHSTPAQPQFVAIAPRTLDR